MTKFSAFSDLLELGVGLPIDCKMVESNTVIGGQWCMPEPKSLYDTMIWTYENRSKSMELGREYSKYIHDNFSVEKMGERICTILEGLILSKDKVLHNKGYQYMPDFVRSMTDNMV